MTYETRMPGWSVASSAGVGGLYAALTPIAALLLLAPSNYGHFSIVYLIHAFGISLQYSIVSEAWTRTFKSTGSSSAWSEYSTALISLSAVLAVAAAATAVALSDLRSTWWVFGVAVFFAVYRNGARYFVASIGDPIRVLVSDASGVVAFGVALTLLWSTAPIALVAGAWCSASVVSALALGIPRFHLRSGISAWLRTHGHAIKPLLSDSLLMDAGAIGTPFLLAGFMGATRFGVYRAVSNAGLPVRLLVEPLRPNIGRLTRSQLFGRTVSTVIAFAAISLSVACYLALVIVVPLFAGNVGTLSSLVEFAVPTAVYVAGSVIGSVYFIACRGNSSHRAIMAGRIVQTVLVVVLPVGGFVVADLAGAIWGYALASLLSSLVWLGIARAGNANATTNKR